MQCIFPKFFSSDLRSSIFWLFLSLKGRLFHKRLPLKVTEFVPKFTDFAGSISNLLPFLKLWGMGFVLKQCHINSGLNCIMLLQTSKAKIRRCFWWIEMSLWFVIFTINYLKCSLVNFQNFVYCGFTCKHPNNKSIVKLAIYASISKNSSFLYR